MTTSATAPVTTSPSGRRAGLALLATVVLGLCAPPAGSQDLELLGQSADGFVSRWLLEGQPAAAVEQYLVRAPWLFDEGFLPGHSYSLSEFRERFGWGLEYTPGARKLEAPEFRRRLVAYLGAVLAEAPTLAGGNPLSRDMLVPFGDQRLEALRAVWKDVGADVQSLPGLEPAVSLPVRGWRDISWSSSPTPGLRFALGPIIREHHLEARAVVLAFRSEALSQPGLLMTLWAFEERTWRVFGVEFPSSE